MANAAPNNTVTLDKLKSVFGDAILKSEMFRGDLTVYIKRERILEVMTYLKNDTEMAFDMLTDLTAVDYLLMEKSPRFQVVYHLRAMGTGRRICVKVPVSENDCHVPTMSSLWAVANWQERETYEMYGITFDDHPDLRRLLTPNTFTHYPLRKDYPLRGKGERELILPEGS